MFPAPASLNTDRVTKGPIPDQMEKQFCQYCLSLVGTSKKSDLLHLQAPCRQGIHGNLFSGEQKEVHGADGDIECDSCWPIVLSVAHPSSAPPHQTPLACAPAAA